jgi:hypothetical protein
MLVPPPLVLVLVRFFFLPELSQWVHEGTALSSGAGTGLVADTVKVRRKKVHKQSHHVLSQSETSSAQARLIKNRSNKAEVLSEMTRPLGLKCVAELVL